MTNPLRTIATRDELAALAAKGELCGIYDVPEAVYHGSGIGLSQSMLKAFARSPRHLREMLSTPREPSDEMVIGAALHCLVLEGAHFRERYAVLPEGIDRRTKAGKAAYADAVVAAAGKTLLPAWAMAQVEGMASALASSPMARAILGGATGPREVSAYWTMEGVLCRGRFDLPTTLSIMVDLKTSGDASPEAFRRSCWNFRYDWQHAFYGLGVETLRASLGEAVMPPLDGHLWLVVERDRPHGVACYRATDEDLARARADVLSMVRRYADCLAKDEWPCYPDEVLDLAMPAWGR